MARILFLTSAEWWNRAILAFEFAESVGRRNFRLHVMEIRLRIPNAGLSCDICD